MGKAAINFKDLPQELQKGINGASKPVPERLVIFGKVLQVLEGLSNRDARWVLRKALKELGGK